MKLVLATPLYPPDIAEPAPYTKELARRLSKEHEVTVLAYGNSPEHLPGVRMVAIDKGRPMFERLFAYAWALRAEARRADIIYAMNGASVELPLVIGIPFSKKRIVFGLADTTAHEHAGMLRHILERIAIGHAAAVIRTMPLPRPEILPFTPYPQDAFDAYERSWESHLASFEELCKRK